MHFLKEIGVSSVQTFDATTVGYIMYGEHSVNVIKENLKFKNDYY